MIRTSSMQAELVTIPDVSYVAGRSAVALAPSDLDPAIVIDGTVYDETTTYTASTLYTITYLYDQLRVDIDGSLITRAYDPEMH